MNECKCRRKEHAVAALDQLVADGADQVGLASPRQSKGEQIVATLDEPAFAERRQHLRDLGRQARAREGPERLLGQQVRFLEVPLDSAPASLVDLELGEVMEVLPERPTFALGLLRDLAGVARERR